MYLVNVTADGCRIYSQQLQVVMQSLSGDSRVVDCLAHNDLVHESGVLHPIKGVLVLVGE